MGDIYDTTNRQWKLDGRHLVRQQDFWYVMGMTTWIALPWICTREVPVDIELVSSNQQTILSLSDAHTPSLTAFAQGGHCTLPARYAAKPARPHQSKRCEGVPRFWYHFVGAFSHCVVRRDRPPYSIREGTHAKYHYMICGVQGP